LDIYIHQAGKGYLVFAGRRYQRGHGLGSIFGGLFKAAMPLLKKGAKTLELLLPIPISHIGLCRWNFK
jgi:hypothetical protein